MIRRATTGDAPFIQRVHEESIRGLRGGPYSRAELDSWAYGLRSDRYAWSMTLGGEAYLVAETVGAGVVGFCSFSGGRVVGLYILGDWSGRGVGSALLGRAEDFIRAAGHDSVHLDAALTSASFYRARGYQEVRRRDWKTRGGLVVRAAEMVKGLRPIPAARARARR